MQIYGLVILSFMAGVIWGFEPRRRRATGRDCSTLVGAAADLGFHCCHRSHGNRRFGASGGFVPLLPIDWTAARAGLAPPWWMRLRLLLTTVVAACLIVGTGAQS
jgi:hypothetical protein